MVVVQITVPNDILCRKTCPYLVYVVLLGLGWPVNHVLLEYDGMFKRFDEGQ